MDARYGAVIVTSANALRGIKHRLKSHHLFDCRCSRSGTPRRRPATPGLPMLIAAGGDAASLRDVVLAGVKARNWKAATLLYLAGADLARDPAAELGEAGLRVVTQTTDRMVSGSEPCRRGSRGLCRRPDRGGSALFPASARSSWRARPTRRRRCLPTACGPPDGSAAPSSDELGPRYPLASPKRPPGRR